MKLETVRATTSLVSLLEVSGAQVEAALSEIETVAGELTTCFIELSDITSRFSEVSDSQAVNSKGERPKSVLLTSEKIKTAAVVQLQTFDRTIQRLSHLRESLFLMADDIQKKSKGNERLEITGDITSQIRSLFSIPHENELFELVRNGGSREELIVLSRKPATEEKIIDEELF